MAQNLKIELFCRIFEKFPANRQNWKICTVNSLDYAFAHSLQKPFDDNLKNDSAMCSSSLGIIKKLPIHDKAAFEPQSTSVCSQLLFSVVYRLSVSFDLSGQRKRYVRLRTQIFWTLLIPVQVFPLLIGSLLLHAAANFFSCCMIRPLCCNYECTSHMRSENRQAVVFHSSLKFILIHRLI